MASDKKVNPWSSYADKDALKEVYKEFGNWARHYSAVRMTLATFFVTVAFSILNFRWDKPELLTALSALAVIAIGFVAFMLFSIATFKRMNDQILVNEALGHPLKPAWKPYCAWTEPSGFPLALFFLILFLLVDWYWLKG